MKVYLLAVAFVAFGVLVPGNFAQSAPCTTPTRQPGMCVRIERCKNIYDIIRSKTPMPQYDNYINRAACTLPGVPRSICCQLIEIGPEPTTTKPMLTTRLTENLLPTECGQSVSDRIAYGDETKVFEYPWMALLMYRKRRYIPACGGSIINERYVLTAAHCLKTKRTMRIDHVILGEHTRSTEIDCNIYRAVNGEEIDRHCADPAEKYKVESFVIHPDFNRPKFANDIGLIRLERDITWKYHIRPICLPVTSELRSKQFEQYVVTGWGTTENQTGSDVLLKAVLPFLSNADCKPKMNRLNVTLSDKQMCAGGESLVDTCRGDSGGPLGFSTNYNGVRFVQFGIVSAGVATCGKHVVPGIYCRVASYMDWILQNMRP